MQADQQPARRSMRATHNTSKKNEQLVQHLVHKGKQLMGQQKKAVGAAATATATAAVSAIMNGLHET
jgi:hypothetical protein